MLYFEWQLQTLFEWLTNLMLTSELPGNTTRMNVTVHVLIFYWEDEFVEPLNFKFFNDKKEEVLILRDNLLRQAKSYVDNNFNLTKFNVIDPTKDIFTQALSIKEIVDDLEISKDDCYRSFSIF